MQRRPCPAASTTLVQHWQQLASVWSAFPQRHWENNWCASRIGEGPWCAYRRRAHSGRRCTRNLSLPFPWRLTDIRRYLETGVRRIIGIGRNVQYLRKDGELFEGHLSVSEMKIGSTRYFCGIIKDASEVVTAQRSLMETQSQLKGARSLHHVPDCRV